jgi:hypothetical protein
MIGSQEGEWSKWSSLLFLLPPPSPKSRALGLLTVGLRWGVMLSTAPRCSPFPSSLVVLSLFEVVHPHPLSWLSSQYQCSDCIQPQSSTLSGSGLPIKATIVSNRPSATVVDTSTGGPGIGNTPPVGQGCTVPAWVLSLTPPFSHWARHMPTLFLYPHPFTLSPLSTHFTSTSLLGHSFLNGSWASCRISRVWGVVPYSPVFVAPSPCHHPFLLGPSHAHPSSQPPYSSLGLQSPRPFLTAVCMGACPLCGHPSPSFTDYMRLCMGDTSPPWTHT